MIKYNTFTNIGIYLMLFLIIILLISIFISLNNKKNFDKPSNCYEECRTSGNSMYYCNTMCNNIINDYNHNNEKIIHHKYSFSNPFQTQEQNVIVNPLPSEPKGNDGPIEPINNIESTNIVNNEPLPGTPTTITETFLI